MSFNGFIDRIPTKIHARTKTFISKDLAIFKPEKYVIQSKIRMELTFRPSFYQRK